MAIELGTTTTTLTARAAANTHPDSVYDATAGVQSTPEGEPARQLLAFPSRREQCLGASIRELCESHNNDYSCFGPLVNHTPMRTSIIIPCYNEAEILKTCLERLCSHPEIEKYHRYFDIIAVNDGSGDYIRSACAGISPYCSFRFIELPVNQGAGMARNAGLLAASGELIVFIDSDVLLPNGYFSEQWRIHNSIPNAVSVGLAENVSPGDRSLEGALRNHDNKPDISQDFRWSNSSLYRVCELPEKTRFLQETDNFKHFNSERVGGWTLAEMVVSHNMALRADRAREVGGFDPRFVGYGSEDTFLGAKLIAAGNFVVPLTESGVFRIRHKPRSGDDDQQLRESLRATLRLNGFLDEPLSQHIITSRPARIPRIA